MDGTDNQQDDALKQTSVGTKGTSTPGTFNQESQNKAVSDALALAGRDAKSITDRMGEATQILSDANALKAKVEDAQAALQKTKDDAELEAAKGNPDLQTLYKLKQTLRTQEADLIKREADLTTKVKLHEEKLTAADATKREIVIWGVAQKYTLDPAVLKTKADELKLTTDEQLDTLAKAMSEGKDTAGLHGDTGKTTGAGEKTVEQKLKDRYPTMH